MTGGGWNVACGMTGGTAAAGGVAGLAAGEISGYLTAAYGTTAADRREAAGREAAAASRPGAHRSLG